MVGDGAWAQDRSGRRYPLTDGRWRGDDGTPLTVGDLPGIARADLDTTVRSQWRYAAALPPVVSLPISMGEGRTPMLDVRLAGVALQVKPEWVNPTASYKDRGVSVMVSALVAQGASEILEDSSGNAGSSVAAYAAAGGIRATILAPEGTSEAKLLQARAHGAMVELVPGTRSATADEAVRRATAAGTPAYASHSWHPMFVQGVKLLAYEIWEDLRFRAPEAVIVPAGGGGLVLGLATGFAELVRSGQIERAPRLLVAQPANCAPLAAAFDAGAADVTEGEWAPTIAEGASIARPVRAPEVLAAIRASGGDVATVGERAIAAATRDLARRGLYAEPTSAVAAAAVPVFAERGLLVPAGTFVLMLTGSALKAPDALRRALSLD